MKKANQKKAIVPVVAVVLVLIVVAIIGGFFIFQKSEKQDTGDSGRNTIESSDIKTPTPTPTPSPGQQSTTKTIEITSSGFSPSSVTIKAGDAVIFINKDSKKHWPASDVHPTHTLYPETGGCIGSKFDACKGLSPGESYSHIFNIKGTWSFHDHLLPGLSGTITVQ